MGAELGHGQRAADTGAAQAHVIEFTPKAASDIRRLYSFLAEKNPNAATKAIAAMLRKLELVERMPHLGRQTSAPRIRETGVRYGKNGYVIQYTLRENDTVLIVLRIWHGREERP